MSSAEIRVLTNDDAMQLGIDATLVAMRWDVIPWCLVMDLDVAASEHPAQSWVHRAWLVFVGMSELTWNVQNARLPRGVVCTSQIRRESAPGGFTKYELPLLAPKFVNERAFAPSPRAHATIRSKACIGAVSRDKRQIADSSYYQERQSLASDQDLMSKLGDVWALSGASM